MKSRAYRLVPRVKMMRKRETKTGVGSGEIFSGGNGITLLSMSCDNTSRIRHALQAFRSSGQETGCSEFFGFMKRHDLCYTVRARPEKHVISVQLIRSDNAARDLPPEFLGDFAPAHALQPSLIAWSRGRFPRVSAHDVVQVCRG